MAETNNELLSSLLERVARLESAQTLRAQAPVSSGSGGWNWLQPVQQIVYNTGLTTSTAYADSGSGQYVPAWATEALIMAAVEDTNGGAGRTKVLIRSGKLTDIPVASIFEVTNTMADSSATQSIIPCIGGRFDWRLDADPGVTLARVRIELLAYR